MMEQFHSLIGRNLFDAGAIAPEIMVAATFIMALIFDFTLPQTRRQGTGWLCVAGLSMALWLNLKQNYFFIYEHAGSQDAFSGMIRYDHFSAAFKAILLVGTIVSVVMAIHARELFGRNHGEFYLLQTSVCLGGMFLCSASNLLMLYLSLESLSIVSYAMAGYLRHDRKSSEAGIKYVIYGAMASGIMLFGMSYLYGLTGTLGLYGDNGVADIVSHWGRDAATRGVPLSGLIAVLALVFAGFLYKIAAVPFHYWSPDVYEGAPTTAAGFFSVVPKAAGFAALIRVTLALFPVGEPRTAGTYLGSNLEQIIVVLSVATMTLGNLAALGQLNVKRMLAYSSIAHAGYMLAGLSVLSDTGGAAAILFYLAAYLLMNLGVFLVVVAMENIYGGSDLRHLRGGIRREPILGVALIIFLFSLTGLPPLAGFMGKWFIMVKLAQSGRYGLIFWVGMNSVISLYYYMKIAKAIAIDPPVEGLEPKGHSPFSYKLMAVCKSVALVLLFIYSEPLMAICQRALSR